MLKFFVDQLSVKKTTNIVYTVNKINKVLFLFTLDTYRIINIFCNIKINLIYSI